MNKEQVYNNQINTHMTAILDICKEHRIAMVASFALPTADDPELMCTSATLTDEFEPPDELLRALRELRGRNSSLFAFTVTTEREEPDHE